MGAVLRVLLFRVYPLMTSIIPYSFITCVNLTSTARTLICGSSTGSIHFWDALSGADEAADNSMGCAPTHSHPITCVALSSDGTPFFIVLFVTFIIFPIDVTIASGDECGNIRLRTASNCILSEYEYNSLD